MAPNPCEVSIERRRDGVAAAVSGADRTSAQRTNVRGDNTMNECEPRSTTRGSHRRQRGFLRRQWRWGIVAVAAATAGTIVPLPQASGAAPPPSVGIVCSDGSTSSTAAGPQRSFVLTARDGYIATPDGNSIYMWGYSSGAGPFQHPGPVLCAEAGEHLVVTLRNTLAADTSIMFPGLEGMLANGLPAQPVPGAAMSLVNPVAPGGTITYEVDVPAAGTYLYRSGTDTQLQSQMGLFGTLIVRPNDGSDGDGLAQLYEAPTSAFEAEDEYLHLLSEIDPDLHLAIEQGATAYDWTSYKPRYFLVNGRSFPDTIAPNGASWLPSQPYSALVEVEPIITGVSLPAAIRYLSVGEETYAFHPHSNHEQIVGIDGRPIAGLDDPDTLDVDESDRSNDQFAVDVHPGQTIDTLFSWQDQIPWGPDESAGQVPVEGPGGNVQPGQQNRLEGGFWSGSPYLGGTGTKAERGEQQNECGEYYHVAHSHALFQATNYGAAMGGMMTLVRVDPPAPNTCTEIG
jgi:FtsP/CotA-like multicopper oxidase with cupredoxin domain